MQEFAEMLLACIEAYSDAGMAAEQKKFSDTLRGTFSDAQQQALMIRRDAARILHLFLLQVLKVPDEDWGEYKKLKDIYDCRICANAIAQVCVKQLMKPRSRYEFGIHDPFTESEAAEVRDRLNEYIS
jgi:hypothetical protein